MVHYQKEKKPFIAQTVLLSVLLLIFLLLGCHCLFANDYPKADDLQYENCTYISYEYKAAGKASYRYYISVKEYDEPLIIDNIVQGCADETRLRSLSRGETLEVSLEKEGLYVYELSVRGEHILSYEDYLLCHRNNNRVGVIANAVFSVIIGFLLVIGIVHYKKTGKQLFVPHS